MGAVFGLHPAFGVNFRKLDARGAQFAAKVVLRVIAVEGAEQPGTRENIAADTFVRPVVERRVFGLEYRRQQDVFETLALASRTQPEQEDARRRQRRKQNQSAASGFQEGQQQDDRSGDQQTPPPAVSAAVFPVELLKLGPDVGFIAALEIRVVHESAPELALEELGDADVGAFFLGNREKRARRQMHESGEETARHHLDGAVEIGDRGVVGAARGGQLLFDFVERALELHHIFRGLEVGVGFDADHEIAQRGGYGAVGL
ncbi:hypothetical protein SDC9_90507 [bioreactor metagenome]|uniref:Uncharacterized protein n=1 Tax=bioreactor metagenome TaxID=1076179 RepID=A0A644ZS95_9ZZZZ